jgi:hypothetical protein
MLGLAVCVLLSVLGAVGADLETMQRASVRQVGALAVYELGELAGLRRPDGGIAGGRPLAVEVVQDGGPLWLREAFVALVEADAAFEVKPSPNILRVEAVGGETLLAIRLHLWRLGWSVRAPDVLRIRPMPLLFVGVAMLGALVLLWSHRTVVSLVVTGVLAQGVVAFLPWPHQLAPASLTDAWFRGPLGRGLVVAARSMSDLGAAVVTGGIVLCVMLLAFERRGARDRPEEPGVAVLVVVSGLGFLGVLGYVEAGLRLGLWPWMTTFWGWLGLVGLVGAWAIATARARGHRGA